MRAFDLVLETTGDESLDETEYILKLLVLMVSLDRMVQE